MFLYEVSKYMKCFFKKSFTFQFLQNHLLAQDVTTKPKYLLLFSFKKDALLPPLRAALYPRTREK